MIENGKTFEMIKDINDSRSVWKLAVLVKIYGLVASHFSDAVVMISGTVKIWPRKKEEGGGHTLMSLVRKLRRKEEYNLLG
ncbi:hypothetical protein P8452_49938 [Trifolium repens]|nr:hypothetical protein P8452_49938 [Trifolium repens]